MMSVEKQFVHLKIQLAAIISATNNFSEENCIGKGGFGNVYKGDLVHSKGKTKVAVKRLASEFGQGNSEFWKEVIMLSVYRHDNIITLLGFCDEMSEKILVYDYVSNKSLDLHLNNKDLTWVRRLTICIGAARGLAYLHNPAKTHQRVLHRDIKSSNVLLDENWNAKIADFGLSKFGPAANQQYTFIVSNNVVGTIGYCDPLYLESGLLTKESDVYSFGVVLFEVLCGRLCIGKFDNSQTFTQLVRKHYKEDDMYGIIFSHIKDEIHPSSLKAFSTIAYQCLKRDHKRRPLMTEIATQLETALNYQVSNQIDQLKTIITSSKRTLQIRPHLIGSLSQLNENLLMIEPKESEAAESFDDLEKLKSALQNVNAELEEEREASATAASEALSMILRLQEEKAKMQMEALQYKKMMEEQSEIRSRSFATNQE